MVEFLEKSVENLGLSNEISEAKEGFFGKNNTMVILEAPSPFCTKGVTTIDYQFNQNKNNVISVKTTRYDDETLFWCFSCSFLVVIVLKPVSTPFFTVYSYTRPVSGCRGNTRRLSTVKYSSYAISGTNSCSVATVPPTNQGLVP